MNSLDIRSAVKHSLYMLAELPLGIVYFTVAVTGLSLAIGLLPAFLLGIPVFVGIMGLAAIVLKFEYTRSHALLGVMPEGLPDHHHNDVPQGILGHAKAALLSTESWKGVLFMLLKLPLGIAAFTFTVTALSLSLGLLAYPIVHYILLQSIQVDIYENNVLALFTNLGQTEQSLIYFALGVLVTYGVIKLIPKVSKAYLSLHHMFMKV